MFATTERSVLPPYSHDTQHFFGPFVMAEVATLACVLCALMLVSLNLRKQRRWSMLFFVVGRAIAMVSASGCGGGGTGGGGGGGGNPGSPTGQFSVTVSLTINGATSSVPVTLSVQ
jgi:hypothetical protein